MKAVSKISRGQLIALLLASRLSNCLLFTSDSFEQFTLTDCLLSMLLDGIFLFLLFVPTLFVLRKGQLGTATAAYRISKGFGKTVDGAYMLLSLFILGLDIVQFSDFASKTMKAGFSVPVLTVAFIVACLLASFYGIQALSRSSTVVAVFSILCLAVFVIALIPQMQWVNFPPERSGESSRILTKAIADLPRTAEVTAIGLLYPYVKGSRTGACAGFAGATSFFSAAVSVTAVAVLGDFSSMTFYPYYAAVTAAQVGVFQRLDILVTAVWLGTFFVRFTLFCMLLLDCARRFFSKKAGVPTAVVSFGILTALAFLIQGGSYSGEWQLVTHIYWWMLGVFCVVLPVLLWIIGRRKLHEKV